MKWFFGFNEHATKWFSDMVKVAVVTAAAHAPELQPNCLYDGAVESELIAWLRNRGVVVRYTTVAFVERLTAPDVIDRNSGTSYNPVAARGFYLCLAVPTAALGEERVLFTDCDVMFTGAIDLTPIRPSVLAAAPEMLNVGYPAPGNGDAGFNSGVMLMNVVGMTSKVPRIADVLEADGYYRFPKANAIYDQGALNTAIPRGEWDLLPDTLNWRPAFGVNSDASIVHWHGPKPRHVERSLATAVSTAPDDAMRSMFDAAPESYRHYLEIFRAALSEA